MPDNISNFIDLAQQVDIHPDGDDASTDHAIHLMMHSVGKLSKEGLPKQQAVECTIELLWAIVQYNKLNDITMEEVSSAGVAMMQSIGDHFLPDADQ